ncbi:hypothetical protein KIN20_017548 [Parelaphostrongylus tenuis]|uniref:Uncharacterized protein n=1 Tax=Parelaphostrongylus tenuis TaxID=148309 RepID=A0AAD5QQV4_PARTN|nr:hypothetical protein KIN20_017548 [Parelaphostrongylus tenuis]
MFGASALFAHLDGVHSVDENATASFPSHRSRPWGISCSFRYGTGLAQLRNKLCLLES